MMPPVPGEDGASLSTRPRCCSACITMFGAVDRPVFALVGTSACDPHRQPTPSGWLGSPRSNSGQTPAPIGGTMYTPIAGPVGPASGTHGSAHVDGIGPYTSGIM